MLNPPKSLLTLGASLMGLRTRRRLQGSGWALKAQVRQALALRAKLSATVYGREHGVELSMRENTWRERVPLRTYEGFASYVERMKAGEADVLWPGLCHYFAVSSGTTAGRTKYLPITSDMLEHFRRAGLDSLLFYSTRVGRADIFGGKHLFLGGATTLSPLAESKHEAFAGDLSGITALHLPGWVEKHLYEPGMEIAQIADWPAKIEAIVQRCVDRDIRMLAGIPSWVLILAAAMMEEAGLRGGGGKTFRTLREVWPRFECLVHGGVPIGPFAAELHAVCGPGVNFHEVYPASEGFIAAQDAEAEAGLRLMADVGVFYEFLPLVDYDESRLSVLGARAVPLEGVKVGVDYVLIMSTPAGLTRYVIGDVVRFISTEPARLVYAGRTKLQLSAFGEHVIEKELTDALTVVCARHHWQVVNFHVAPIFMSSMTSRKRGSHEWWLELRSTGNVENPTGPIIAELLDVELQRLNDDYEAKRKGGGLFPPTVRLVAPGVFEQWQRAAGRWGGQNKMPRCRGDRQVADELAKFAPFHDVQH